jgi:hypothetical protein
MHPARACGAKRCGQRYRVHRRQETTTANAGATFRTVKNQYGRFRGILTVSARPGTVLVTMVASLDTMLEKMMMERGTPHERNCSICCVHAHDWSPSQRVIKNHKISSCALLAFHTPKAKQVQQKVWGTYDIVYRRRHQGLRDGRAVGIVF